MHLAFVEICGREEMGIASQEVIRQLQELIDQGLCFTNFLLLLSLFSFKDHIFFKNAILLH